MERAGEERPGPLGRAWERDSIRFQLSLMLLLSALNAIVLASVGVAVLSSLAFQDLGPAPSRALERVYALSDAQRAWLEGRGPALAPEELDALEAELRAAGPQAEEALSALAAYREELRGNAGEEPSPEQERELRAGLHRLLGAVELFSRRRPPSWMERNPWPLAALLGWTLLSAGLTVLGAFRLRHWLSIPLERLSEAARAVAGGELERAVELDAPSRELRELARSLEAMRRRLVHSITALDRRNAVVKAMLDALGDGVVFLDTAGRVQAHNPRAAEILLGLPGPRAALAERVPLRAALPELDPELLRSSEARELRLSFELGGGLKRHLELYLRPLSGLRPDLAEAHILVLRDVTEAVEAEEVKRSFLSVVTHELKTPLTVVLGSLKLLLAGKGGGLSPAQERLARRGAEQAELLGRMIQELLDATRLEGGQLPLEMEEVELAPLLREVAEGFEGAARERGIRLRWELPEEGLRARVDPLRFRQVVGNLLGNALKFTPEGGRVRLEAGEAEEELWVAVEDTGRGIPEAALPRLFEKFYQVERGDTRRAGGAGLGLYISQRLVEAMGGRIEVSSRLGEGSRFTVFLPRPGRGGEP